MPLCTVTLSLNIRPSFKVMIHPWDKDNICVFLSRLGEGVISYFLDIINVNRQTDRLTERRTDGRTDGQLTG